MLKEVLKEKKPVDELQFVMHFYFPLIGFHFVLCLGNKCSYFGKFLLPRQAANSSYYQRFSMCTKISKSLPNDSTK